MKWWQERYINRRDYILEHLDALSMDSDETVMVLLIDFFNQYGVSVTHELLAEKMKKRPEEIDALFAKLNTRGYVSIDVREGKVMFQIDGIFEEEKSADAFDESLFQLFETEFGRTLSQMELQRMSEWIQMYDAKLIGYALREALTYNVKNFDYIDRILTEWKKKGLTAEQYEEGER